MVEDASEFMGTQAPPADGFPGSQEYHYIYVEDVDATIDQAVKHGATVKRPATDQFYGDRDGYIVDPFGHGWVVASHVEDVSGEEMAKRMNEMFGQG
jgi:PhnB protein